MTTINDQAPIGFSRAQADEIALERLELIYDFADEYEGWDEYSDSKKLEVINEAIAQVEIEIESFPELETTMRHEISELKRAKSFFEVAIGATPVEGQLVLITE